jgi:2-polyprenyl-3-methyl-5-hydroxy-6-metoxy-1,4-benzoquinol methylase
MPQDQKREQPVRLAHAQRAATGEAAEAERWNEVFLRGVTFNLEPNNLLAEVIKGRKPGTALDVAMGQGRNALYLAKQGWDVTGLDISAVGIAQAQDEARRQGVKLTIAFQSVDDFDFGTGRWDLIALIYFGAREYVDRVRQGLKPGGIVVVEGFHRDTAKAAKIGASVVFDTGELPRLFAGFRILRYEDVEATGDYGLEKARLVRLVAQKEQP